MMFSSYFNLKFNPFLETPDVDLFYQSQAHKFVLYKLVESIEMNHGFTLLTGEVGVGKTLLSRIIIDLTKEEMSSALIFYPKLNEIDLLKSILHEYGCETKTDSYKDLFDSLTDYLLTNYEQGRKALLIIDEAQNLPVEALETVRMLSNIELNNQKLIQIVLVGQPELGERLKAYDLRQVNQRIATRLSLESMSATDTDYYIKDRIENMGGGNFLRFDESALKLIFKLSKGIPRLINMICEYSLKEADYRRVRLIQKTTVIEALKRNNLIEKQPFYRSLFGEIRLVQR